jgi:nucleotide-binding universal stress UspA family protein
MNAWRKICCAVDLSDPSRQAMEEAADLAARVRGELTLVHVHIPSPPVAGDVLTSPGEESRVEIREMEWALERWREEAQRRSGVPVWTRVLVGDPAIELVRHAHETGCDLLVVGTHGRAGLTRLVLGSVAEKVVRHAPCPVLVAREAPDVALSDAEEAAQYA